MLDTAERTGKRNLSAQKVAQAALDMVNRGGYEALTFRPLAKELGCEAMSLYHYFPSKAHLRDALVDLVLCEASADRDATASWRDQIATAARSYRRALLLNPGLAPVVLAHRLDHPAGCSFRAGFLDLLQIDGLGAARQAIYFHTLFGFIGGAVLDELRDYPVAALSGAAPVSQSAMDEAADKIERLSIFNLGIDCILERLSREIESQPTSSVTPIRSRAGLRQARRAARMQRQA